MKRGTGWPIAVATILGLTIAANVWIVRVANRDPSVAVEPDYYQKAVHWDDELAQRARNDSLGWRLTPALHDTGTDAAGTLDVTLEDHGGTPLSGARIAVVAIHNTRASRPITLLLRDEGRGAYRAAFPGWRRGMWELRFDIHRGDAHFTADRRVDTDAAAPTGS